MTSNEISSYDYFAQGARTDKINRVLVRGVIYASIPMLKDMCAFVEEHNIKPVIASVFEWTEAKHAYLAQLNLKTAGKIVIKVD